ncbi:hypothetical protein [Nesterenkonia sp.]|uniref:hypothetical protein n=1 Tax=Nesterenkonia sp. TaxID=704201 RepID=UPI0026214D10|nr:hypothetical protein [Nesterenkonia sp.]
MTAPQNDPHESGEPDGQGPESGSDRRCDRDHAADVPRTARGALPPAVIIIAIIIFALGFFLFRQWRRQYVDYGVGSVGELPAVLGVLGLG